MRTAVTKTAALTQDALTAYQSGEIARAEQLFKKAASGPSSPPQTAYNYAVFLRREGRVQDAVYWLDRCLRSAPDHKNAQIERGLALIDLGQLEEAAVGLQAFPDDPDALRGMSVAAFKLGHWEKAVTAIQNMAPQARAEDRLLLIRALAELGRLKEAEAAGAALKAERADLGADISKALSRRAKGRFSLIETD
jgi:tetratricopeptide (TPR) repeat protein